ncbi:MAG: NUDIX hydrolase [Myxococcota bacterium]
MSAETPSTLRQAATVVVTRPTAAADDVEIYMVQRSAKSPFMPSTLVFPGGRLDADDGPPEEDATWVRAAIRECEEETGLDLPERLLWFDTWLTPSGESRRRYLTRFYWTQIDRDTGDRAEADGHETHDGRWATAAAHLEAWTAETVDLPPPTLCTLLRLAPLGPDAAHALATLEPSAVILPKIELSPARIQIVMPHDPAYDDLPGEAMPAPERVRSLPTRFSRKERVWTPDDSPSPAS